MHTSLSRSRLSRAPTEPASRPFGARLVRPAIFVGVYGLLAAGAWRLPAAAWNAAFTALVLLVLWELYALVALRSRLLRGVGLVASALLLLQPLLAPALPGTLILSVAWICCLALVSLSTARPRRRELHEVLLMICGLFAVTLALGQLVAIRYLAGGREWTTLVILAVAARESTAALGGLVFPGAPVINEQVSPRKSYAGWALGAAASLAAAVVLTRAWGLAVTAGQAVVLGLAIGAACQLGDLSESYLKRVMGRRHSGRALGPQGGLLDTTDALAFAAVVVHGLLLVWGSGAGP
jgi:phosphatidate cytidylyltransferase